MTNNSNGSEVVYRWSDSTCQTGDYFIRTADGSTWKATQVPQHTGTGDVRAYLRDGKVYR